MTATNKNEMREELEREFAIKETVRNICKDYYGEDVDPDTGDFLEFLIEQLEFKLTPVYLSWHKKQREKEDINSVLAKLPVYMGDKYGQLHFLYIERQSMEKYDAYYMSDIETTMDSFGHGKTLLDALNDLRNKLNKEEKDNEKN